MCIRELRRRGTRISQKNAAGFQRLHRFDLATRNKKRDRAQAILPEMSYLINVLIMTRLNLHTKHIVAICKRYHVATISLFGSMARNEATEASLSPYLRDHILKERQLVYPA
jgi:hypothetical protein